MKAKEEIKVEFYNKNLDDALSGAKISTYNYPPTVRNIKKLLNSLIGVHNVKIDLVQQNRVFIKDFIFFCKEGPIFPLDYKSIHQWEVIKDDDTFKIIVNPGSKENVKLISI